MMMVVVAARSGAKTGIIADMLAFVHTFIVGAVRFKAVGFSSILVTLSRDRILIAVLVTILVSALITGSVSTRRVVSKRGSATEPNCANSQDQKSRKEVFH